MQQITSVTEYDRFGHKHGREEGLLLRDRAETGRGADGWLTDGEGEECNTYTLSVRPSLALEWADSQLAEAHAHASWARNQHVARRPRPRMQVRTNSPDGR